MAEGRGVTVGFLVVKGIEGLGNRLMCVANAIEYCQKTNRTLYIDWTDGMYADKGINAFHLFFDIKGILYEEDASNVVGETFYPEYAGYLPFDFKTRDYFTSYHYRDCHRIVQRLIDLMSSCVHFFCSEDTFKKFHILWYHRCAKDKNVRKKLRNPWGDIATFGSDLPLSRKEDVVFFMDFAPCYSSDILRENICLKPNIQKEVDDFLKKNEMFNKTMAIHIRDTDKRHDADYEQLIGYIREFMEKHQLEKIYVATDQKNVHDLFMKAFQNRVIFYTDDIPEIDNQDGIGLHMWAEQAENLQLRAKIFHDSIMDMWLLSKAKYLLYQGNSTFSMISKELKKGKNCLDWQKIVQGAFKDDQRY